jgi:sterol desaturase/sphingolipid hydroxylase (fatty acid hydroxylase superfamily)
VTTVSEELRYRLPSLIANVAIAGSFAGMSYLVLWALNGISTEIVFLLQIGLLLAAGIFLVRTLFDALMIVDKATALFMRRLGIKEDWSRQRIFKDTAYIVAILLVAAAIFPLFSEISNFGNLLQEITTYAALGLILLFVYDIARTFYRITEKKANSVANRISSNEETEINGK